MYDQETDTWYPIGGSINTNSPYNWSATQTFISTLDAQSVLNARAGINNFQNPAARDAIITSPTNGVVAFVRNDADGNVINQLQYYYNGVWRDYNDAASLSSVSANKTLGLSDAGKTIRVSSGSDVTITVPLNSTTPFIVGQRIEIIRKGAGEVSITGETVGVTINSKNSNKKIAAQYSGAVLVKDDVNTWILIGDLKA
jgi:hypothetical protein